MKKTSLRIILSLSLILIVAITLMINNNSIAFASDMSPDRVVLHGTYEGSFSPDTAYVSIGVIDTKSDTVSEVSTLEYTPTNLDIVLSTLEKSGISAENISTREMNISYEMFQNMRANNGSRVSNLVEFKTTDIANLENLITTLNSNATVKCIRYALEDTATSYTSVLNGAIENATMKLNSLVPSGDYRIAEIMEDGCYNPTVYNSFCNINGEISSDSAINMCGNVRVVFEKVGE